MTKDHLADIESHRFTLVDAIRGVAACAVVARHLFFNDSMGPRLEQILPLPIQLLSIWGAAGVYAFFVLSGFVIAHSLRFNALTPAAIGNFALRRQLRLDPPYWAVIALVMLSTLLAPQVLRNLGIGGVLANFFYLQFIVGKPSLVNVAWTLCLEIQFYIVFVALLWLARNRSGERAPFNASPAAIALLLVSAIAALTLVHFRFYLAYFVSYWHYFALGVVIYWALRGALHARWAALYVALCGVSMVLSDWHGINRRFIWHSLSLTAMLVALATALLLWWAGTHGQLARWGDNRVLQYLGRISYSLYLIHPLIVQNAIRVSNHLPQTVGVALLFWLITPLVCVGLAHLLYRLVEAPSVKWSARFKPKRRDAALEEVAVPAV